jgi:hypothetical protein
MKVVAVTLVALVVVGVVGLGAILAWSVHHSRTTSYCPWRHEISDTASCAVLDEAGNRALIQHADLLCLARVC